MPKLTDTYARAYDCCDLILSELGRFPTIDLIRERIGVNSPTTIKRAMNEWTQHFAEKHFDKINRPDIPVTLLHSVEQVWKLAVIEAEKAYLQKEQAYQQQVAKHQTEIATLKQEHELLQTSLGQERLKVAESHQQLELLQQQLAGKMEDNQQLLSSLKESEANLAGQEALMQEQAQRWRQQQEQDQEWFARRLMEEKQFIEEKFLEKIQRQSQQIIALTESETSLRQVCASLRLEQQRLQMVAAKDSHRFKARPKQQAGMNKAVGQPAKEPK
jgi:hypothetical protein